ncbi:MAG: T9SS type A sorting domain-containing protein [Bacteroidetes bacterium]|nr:T9SS type A sorting domain-containing protein [Bacteroidota bacterium]
MKKSVIQTISFLALLLLVTSTVSQAQITISTTSTFLNNNGSGTVTFNFENTNSSDVIITDIEGIVGTTANVSVDFWYKTTPLNGSPGNISVANGWTLVATGTIAGVANTTTTVTQSFFTGLSFLVPAGANYGFAVSAYNGTAGVQRYHTIVAPNLPTVTISAGGCNIVTGDNIGYGGGAPPTTPTNTPRGWLGSISFIPATPCTAPPNAGTTAATDSSVCPNTNFSLSLNGNTLASGLTYQWQSSPNNTVWTDIVGAANINLSTTQTSNTYYRCISTCTGVADTSTSLLITTNTFVDCYCSSNPTGATGSDIGNITIAALNNGTAGTATNNAASVNTYSDFSNLPATALTQGGTYPISITQINSAAFSVNYATAHIDFNHDGLFDPVVETFTLGASTSAVNGNIISSALNIPYTALTGLTRMRIVLRAAGSATQSPCGTYGTGETEDYLVDILQGAVCTAPPTAGAAAASFTSGCSGVATLISLIGNSIGSGQTYQWESSTDSVTWTPISGATNTLYATTITGTLFYHCVVTCNAQSAASAGIKVSQNPPSLCYCVTGLGGGGCASYTINDVVIAGTTLNNLGSICTGTTANTLTVFPPSGNTTASLIQGLSYNLSVTLPVAAYVSVWIDFDGSGTYDVSEWSQVCIPSTSAPNIPNTISISVPFSSIIGQTGMRIRSRSATPNGAPDACLSFGSGETEDYILTIIPNVNCAGTPNAGTAVANASSVCPSVPVALSLNGVTLASGLTYQWESSANNITFAPISGATQPSYSSTQPNSTYYRCIVSCSAAADTSTSIYVTTNTFASCYCTSAATSTADDDIGNVTFGPLNNGIGTPATTNATSVNTYTDFTSLPPQTFFLGFPYPISVTQIDLNGFYVCTIAVFIDYNQDGSYDPATELVFDGTTFAGQLGNIVSGLVVIPASATLGNTGMRVVLREGTVMPSPCGTYTWGETEDYIVNLAQAPPCIAPTAAGTAAASDSTVCPNVNFTLSLAGYSISSGITYQWQASPDNINWSPIAGANTLYYQMSQTSSTYYRCQLICSGVTSTSTALFVALNSFVDCYCTSGPTSAVNNYDIGNVSFGLLNNGIALPVTNNPTSINSYTDFGYLPPVNLVKTLSYPLAVSQINFGTFATCNLGIYIDFDHDGIFDPSGEIILNAQTIGGPNPIRDTILIPSTALSGLTKMRLVLRNGTTSADPCGTYLYGETEDYLVNLLTPNSCSLPFSAGFAKSGTMEVCASDIFSLSIDSLSTDTGYTFQWQKSFDNQTWTSIAGATTQVYLTSQNFDTYYHCNVTCNGGTTVTSTAVHVLNKSVALCDYCNNEINGNCTLENYIDSVAFGQTTFNNANSGCAANAGFAYSKYPGTGNTTTTLGIGNYYDLYVKTIGECSISVWIDYDQSGTFDPEEWKEVSHATVSGLATKVPFVIDDSAKVGVTGMRIRSRIAGSSNLANEACAAFGSGETEDYYITLATAISTGNELEREKDLTIYPNPSNGKISISYYNLDSKSISLMISSMEGKEILKQNSALNANQFNTQLDLTTYPKGIYFIQLTTDKNSITKKLVIK